MEGGRGSGSGGRNRVRHVLVAAEVGLALVVLASAGLMIKSMVRLLAVDPGFDPRNVLTLEIALPQQNTYYGPPDRPRFCQEIEERVGGDRRRAIGRRGSAPSAVAATPAAASGSRDGRSRRRARNRAARTRSPAPGTSIRWACQDLGGREFTVQDTLGSPGVVVINQALAKKYWPNEDPVGRRISIETRGAPQWLTIVGVVGDVRHWGLAREVRPQLFRPYTQAAWPWMQIVVKTDDSARCLRSGRKARDGARPSPIGRSPRRGRWSRSCSARLAHAGSRC